MDDPPHASARFAKQGGEVCLRDLHDAPTFSRRLEPQEHTRLLFEPEDRQRRLTVGEPEHQHVRGERPDVLIVDDSKAMRMIVTRTLRQAGFGDHDWFVQREAFRRGFAAVRRCPLPTVAAVFGFALGVNESARYVDWKKLRLIGAIFSIGGAFFAYVAGGWTAARIAGIRRSAMKRARLSGSTCPSPCEIVSSAMS